MTAAHKKRNKGMTLIEIIVALIVIIIAVIGAMMFRYYSALDARKADIQMNAARVALLTMEGWKAAYGAEDFNPHDEIGLNSQLTGGSNDITISVKTGDSWPVSLTGGTDSNYYVKLISSNDIDGDGTDDPGIRKLDVHVVWKKHAASGTPDSDDWNNRKVKLSSYVIAN